MTKRALSQMFTPEMMERIENLEREFLRRPDFYLQYFTPGL